MRNYKDYESIYRPKKVKHVHFIHDMGLVTLENAINKFADEHPEFKILGIKLLNSEGMYIATITYLCDAPGEFDNYENDYYDDEEEN